MKFKCGYDLYIFTESGFLLKCTNVQTHIHARWCVDILSAFFGSALTSKPLHHSGLIRRHGLAFLLIHGPCLATIVRLQNLGVIDNKIFRTMDMVGEIIGIDDASPTGPEYTFNIIDFATTAARRKLALRPTRP